ncbi:MAG: divergent PAP2 family protein [Proteobacteria bacterium]|nr:divergent PAP2 family protein [Pseudomonadota bacterium]MBU1740638.1 divergent PAP2 family protein [Pseudomonadota bacterium]
MVGFVNQSWGYIIAPGLGWVVAGGLKFLINSIKARRLAWDRVGIYGGMPSTHSCIISTTAFFVGLENGFLSAPFAVALAVGLVVMMDAWGLRRKLGRHAAAINELMADRPQWTPLSERLGHSKIEVLGGVVVGMWTAIGLTLIV